jgi:hypothetical protein
MIAWTNKNKSKWLDIDSVSYWEYASKEQGEKELASKPEEVKFFFVPAATLTVVTHGYMLKFGGNEAEEIYQLLCDKKTLLNG